VSVAVIVFGGALLLGGGVESWMSSRSMFRTAGAESMVMAGGAHILVALASVTLGIIALAHGPIMVLSLVALLSLGSAVLLGGSALGGALLGGLRRTV
jgi:hypothetical protein